MKKLVVLFLFVAAFGVSKAQERELAKFKSLFTLNFIRYIGWPEEATKGDFVIGVLKNNMMVAQLKENTLGKKFGYQNIVIKEFKNIEDIAYCQILYIDGNIDYATNATTISTKLNNKNSLIITEDKGAIVQGSMINFVVVDDKLKFEVSAANAEKHGLKFSNTLLSMNNVVK